MSPAYQRFEQELAWHCAAAMAGIKPADLLCWKAEEDWAALVGYYAVALSRRGIRLRVLRSSGGRLMILVFRPERLKCCLRDPEVAQMLAQAGYPVQEDAPSLLRHLATQLTCADFPHEIGLFLGYPPEDVEGFRRWGGRGCKYSGAWKVYGDVEQARRKFDRYHRCRTALSARLRQGKTLEQVFPVA